MRKPIISNIVDRAHFKDIQTRTLNAIAMSLVSSFGPYGSSTAIAKASGDNIHTKYSKDGRTILKNIIFQDAIEMTVKNDIESICRYIDVNNGDGTTSAILLSESLFRLINIDLKDVDSDLYNITPRDLTKYINIAIGKIKEIILSNKQEFTADTARNIAYISTNGNTEIANIIYDVYKEYGEDVYIEASISPDNNTYVKEYNGLTLETGYAETAFINTTSGKAELHNPQIFIFDDPIDTPIMASLFDAILAKNIFEPIQANQSAIPTVIFAPRISRDLSQFMNTLVSLLYQYKQPNMKPPVLIVTNIYEYEKYDDIRQLCGAKPIKKYIDPKMYELDKGKNLAPDKDNILEFAGTADIIISDARSTSIINPKDMFDEEGNRSIVFENLLRYLNDELSKLDEYVSNDEEKFKLKKRINSLKGSMVEILVGGIDITDRDEKKDLIEDAIKNTRSASRYGVGRASNFEGFSATVELLKNTDDSTQENKYIRAILYDIYYSYVDLYCDLFDLSGVTEHVSNMDGFLKKILEDKAPYDVVLKTTNKDLMSSIMTDVDMLEAMSKILSLMITSNQYLVPDIIYNKYNYPLDDITDDESDKVSLSDKSNELTEEEINQAANNRVDLYEDMIKEKIAKYILDHPDELEFTIEFDTGNELSTQYANLIGVKVEPQSEDRPDLYKIEYWWTDIPNTRYAYNMIVEEVDGRRIV